MTWTGGSAVDGTKTAKGNRPRINENFEYIQTEMRDDHYWDQSANKDGHHSKVEMPNVEDSGVTVDATTKDPTGLSNDMKVMYYTRPKIAAESTDSQINEPFAFVIDTVSDPNVNQYMQLGFRVIGNIIMTSATAGAVRYSHNINTTTPIQRPSGGGTGTYQINFNNDLPSENFIPLVQVFSTGNARISVPRTGTYSTSFSKEYFQFIVTSFGGAPTDLVSGDRVLITIVGG